MPAAHAPDTADSARTPICDIPLQSRAAVVRPATYREADNSLEVVWTTGSRRRMYDWSTGRVVEEELVVTPDAVDMSRFQAGTVQVIDGHDTYSGVSAILGIALDGRIEAGQGLSRIALSTDPNKAGPVGDIRAGIIRAMSFGYSVQRYERTLAEARTDGGGCDLLRATRWTPHELTFCAVGADPNAAPRSADEAELQRRSQPAQALLPCEFVALPSDFTPAAGTRAATTSQESAMPHPTDPVIVTAPGGATASPDAAQRAASPVAAVTPADPAQDAAIQSARQAELQRSADITDLCQRHAVPHLAAGLIRSAVSLDAARSSVLEELARRDAAGGGHRNARVETVRDEGETRLRGMEEAIMSRVDGRAQLTDNGRQFRGMSLLELGRDMLEAAGVNTRGMDRMTLATRMLTVRSAPGMHTTSDFSSLMANVANRRLRAGYDESAGTYTRWARRAPNAPDFKSMSVVQVSSVPDLMKVNEAGEFKYGSLSDGAESYALVTYGRIVSLSRQAIVNDDLRAFDRLVAGFGAASARLENRTVYAQLTANAALSDGTALFHANHSNLGTGAGSALGFDSLSAGRKAMRLQKGKQSEELNIAPSYLIVPQALEQTAWQLTSPNYTPTAQSGISEFRAGGRAALEPIAEAVLDAASSTAWYLAASNGQVDTVEYCYLDGAEGPVIESEMGFEVDGVCFRARLDFAAKAIDHRGLYKAAGA